MNAASHFAAQWSDILWRATWQGGLVILAVGILCLVARRMPASTRAWLWSLAGIQLFLKLVIAIPIVVQVPAPLATAGGPQAVATNSEMPDSVVVATQSDAPEREAPLPARPDWPLILMTAWGLGGIVVLGAGTRRLLRARSVVINSQPATDPVSTGALEVYWGIAPGMPRLMESDVAPCPMLVGWPNPTIILPARYAERNSEVEVRMAIAHEVTHVLRRHYLFGLSGYLTQIAFFYHPLSWLASREAALAREEVCDLEVLRLTGQSPNSYARLLLKSAQSGAPVAALGVALGYRDLRRRINMLRSPSQDRPSANRRAWTSLVILIALASLPWQIVAQTKHSPTKPVVAKKSHASQHHAVRHHNQVTTITYERVNGVIVRTVNKTVKTVVRLKDVPRGAIVLEQFAPIIRPDQPPTSRYFKGHVAPLNSSTTLFGPMHLAPQASGWMLTAPNTPLVGGSVVPTPFVGGDRRLGFQVVQVDPKNKAAGYKIISPDGHVTYAPFAPGSTGKGSVRIVWSTGANGHATDATASDAVDGMVPPPKTVPGSSGLFVALATGAVVQVAPSVQSTYPAESNGISLVNQESRNHPMSMQTKVNVNFDGIYADAALLRLLKMAGGDYLFRADVPARRLTCKLTNVTIEKALRSILDSLDLHLRVADGTSFIEH